MTEEHLFSTRALALKKSVHVAAFLLKELSKQLWLQVNDREKEVKDRTAVARNRWWLENSRTENILFKHSSRIISFLTEERERELYVVLGAKFSYVSIYCAKPDQGMCETCGRNSVTTARHNELSLHTEFSPQVINLRVLIEWLYAYIVLYIWEKICN